MSTQNSSSEIEDLLDRLLELRGAARQAFIANLRERDPGLCERVLRLLNLCEVDTEFPSELGLTAPTLLAAITDDEQKARIGERLGAYEVKAFIGRGGMGAIYRGERIDGVFEQTVAIKFLPANWASRQRRALFESERQYLAKLEHPNIARIIDAGVAGDGSPYFIMEYIDGEPFDVALENIKTRIALHFFRELCDAVSFCHRSFIVHGDLKPSNILVSDNRVRLLDFGVGRLIETSRDSSSERSFGFSNIFAAPEQKKGATASVTTDVFSLGVLMMKFLPDIANHQELMAIARKASARDPEARYESVEALDDDLKAYGSGRAVAAMPQSRLYLSRKFLTRNWIATAAVTSVFLALSAGLAMTSWQSSVARKQAARAEAVASFLKSMFDRVDPEAAGAQPVTLRQIMDESAQRLSTDLSEAPDIQNEVKGIIATGYLGIGEFELALNIHEEVLTYLQGQLVPPDERLVAAQNNLARAYHNFSRYQEAVDLCRNAASQLEALGQQESEIAAETLICISENLSQMYDAEAALEAVDLKQRALEIYAHLHPNGHPTIAKTLSDLGEAMRATGDHEAAVRYQERALEIAAKNELLSLPSFMRTLCNLALDYAAIGRHQDALQANEECLARKKARLGNDHSEIPSALNNIARLHFLLGNVDKGMIAVREGIDIAQQSFPDTNLTWLALEINHASGLWQSGDSEAAYAVINNVVERMSEQLGATHPATNRARTIEARILLDLGQIAEAEERIAVSMEGLAPSWEADAFLWRSEISLANGDRIAAKRFAEMAAQHRRAIRIFTSWQIAEADFVEGLAANEIAHSKSAANILRELPASHIRHKQAVLYLETLQ